MLWTLYNHLCPAEEEKLARFILVVDVVSHLILQVYMGPTGEEKLYHISMTSDNGPHAGGHAILRNKMKNKMCYHSDKLEIDDASCQSVTPLSENILLNSV